MLKKVLYFDTETTGTDYKDNNIWQIAGAIEIGGEIKEEFNLKFQPFSYEHVEQGAIDTHGVTVEEMKTFMPNIQGYREFVKILGRHVNKFDKTDKYYPAGYNVGFDINMMAEFFKKIGDKYLGSWWNWKDIDPLRVLRWMDFEGLISLDSYKLENVCEHFGFEIDAHDALSDIQATIKVIKKVRELYLKVPSL